LKNAHYAAKFSDVLVPSLDGCTRKKIRNDLAGKGGSELLTKGGRPPKFLAAHSSAALAANTFGPFLGSRSKVRLGRRVFSGPASLEYECPTGLRGVPPTLDFLVDGPTVLAVESKCTEPFSDHEAKFKTAYESIVDAMAPSWRAEYERLLLDPKRYRFLDAAQLLKHYLGLKNCFRDQRIVLAYLYWEPTNADDIASCVIHRAEILEFSNQVAGDPAVEFSALPYPKLWDEWAKRSDLRAHAKALRDRYEVAV
jgi:hypothetical protein